MCGVLFQYSPDCATDAGHQRFAAALKQLTHRGPDGSGIIEKGGALVGHRRLSIIDISGGAQPMTDPSNTVVLSFNGEIYNHDELRRELASNWNFRTRSDSEVLLAGLVLHGIRFIPRLRGMWAFVFWDSQRRTLLASRDPLGKKPLYFTAPATDEFSCASELPPLRLISPADAWLEDIDSTADYLRFGYAMPGHSAYAGVEEVLPGNTLSWTVGQLPQLAPYWCPALERFQGSRIDAEAILRDLLSQAIKRRLLADVEVGALLSGGLDSSVVSAMATQQIDRPLRTFSATFGNGSFDESGQAEAVASYIGSDHLTEPVPSPSFEDIDRLLTNNVGQPFADPSLVPTSMISQVASRSVKVVLTGDGADELLGGYERYRATYLFNWYRRVPARLREVAARSLRKLGEPTDHHSGSLLKRANLFLELERRASDGRIYVAPELFNPSQIESLRPELAGRGHHCPAPEPPADAHEALAMMRSDMQVYLPQDILQKVDRSSMAHSLEVRSPFLDQDLVEFAMTLPTTWLLNAWRGKRILRSAFRNSVPKRTLTRRKQGFAVPVGDWFKGELGELILQRVQSTNSQISPHAVSKLLTQHRRGQHDHGLRLWAIYVLLAPFEASLPQQRIG